MADFDITKLSDDDLESLKTLVKEREMFQAAKIATPGPATPYAAGGKVPLPGTLDPRQEYAPKFGDQPSNEPLISAPGAWLDKSNEQQQGYPGGSLGEAMRLMSKDKTVPYEIRSDPKKLQQRIEEGRKKSLKAGAAAIPWLGGLPGSAAKLAIPATASALGYATTETPADLATVAALTGAGTALKGVKAATRGGNIMSRMLQGLVLSEGGTRLNDALSGREQRSFDPRKRDAQDIITALASMGLGAAQGAHEMPKAPSPVDIFQSHKAKGAQIADALAEVGVEKKKATEAIRPVKNSRQDAETALSAFEERMKASQAAASTGERKAFKEQAGELREREKSLKFEVDDATREAKASEKALKDYQTGNKTGAKTAGGNEAEGVADKILAKQQELDNLRKPVAASDTAAPSTRAEIQATIDQWENNLKNNKYSATQKADIDNFLKERRSALAAARGTVAPANKATADELNADIRELRVQQRRLNQGRETPATNIPGEDTALAKLAEQHQQNLQELELKNQAHRDAQLARLSHAKNTPGATNADVDEVVTHRKILDAVQKATDAEREARAIPGQHGIKEKELQRVLKQHQAAAPPPPNPTMEFVKAILKKSVPAISAGSGAGFGHLAGMSPYATALGATALTKFATSPAGKSLVDFLVTRVGPNATKLIPSLVNQEAERTRTKRR